MLAIMDFSISLDKASSPQEVVLETSHMSIVVVDSDEENLEQLKHILDKSGYARVHVIHDPWQLLAQYQQLRPDLIMTGLSMPRLNGFQLMAALEPMIFGESYLPIILLLGNEHQASKDQILHSIAKDFLHKPYDPVEVKLRVKHALDNRRFYLQTAQRSQIFKTQIEARDAQLENAYYEMITRLAVVAEYRDPKASEHVWRVAQNSYSMAMELGFSLAKSEVFMRSARLHDVGKVAIPDSILYKPGSLTPKEFEIIKTHSSIGAQLLSGGQSPMIKLAASIALTHHERWDGAGYPRGLAGKMIPIEGRIVAVADTFDVMTTDHQHKKALSLEDAAAEIQYQSGKQFDPEVVQAFVNLYERGVLMIQEAKN